MKLSKRVFFEAAHRLTDYEGKCKRIHGHNWIVDIVLTTNRELDKTGFVVDFGDLKKIVDKFDHMLILKVCEENEKIAKSIPVDWVKWTEFNPTCEEFALYFKKQIIEITILREEEVSIEVFEAYKPVSKAGVLV